MRNSVPAATGLRETMTFLTFASAVLALLLAPGPTNTLMGLAGASEGPGRVLRLVPAELLGYLTTILPLTWLGAAYLAEWPAFAGILKVAAAVWVAFLAVRLWGRPESLAGPATVTARRVYVTTMLNPKALVFGLVLLPMPGDTQFLPRLAAFCLMVAAVAVTWGAFGAMTQAGSGGAGRLLFVQRLASAWLMVVAVTLVAGVVRA